MVPGSFSSTISRSLISHFVEGSDLCAGGVNISITAGSQQSEHRSTAHTDRATGSSITAGGDVHLRAAGAGEQSDLTIQGSTVSAADNLTLHADDAITLQAARNEASQRSTDKSSSAGVGVAISLGSNGVAAGITANAAKGRGNANGDDVTHTNTHVTAGRKLILESGGDTNLKGAVASGERVAANVGGNLNLESLQDTRRYHSQSQSQGGSVTAGLGGGVAGSVQAGQQNVDATFASVIEQTAIRAGDGGFDIAVQGKTDLKGSVIASNQSAIDQGHNRFDGQGPVTQSDIVNTETYRGQGWSVSASNDPAKIAGVGAGIGQAGDHQSSVTTSGIGVANETDTAHALTQRFDAQKVAADINAQVTITESFTREA